MAPLEVAPALQVAQTGRLLLGFDLRMTDNIARSRLAVLVWGAIFLVFGFLAGDTVATMQRVGLVGARPPLSVVQTVLRMFIIIVALALLYVFHSVLERIALLIGAAAAGSSALYGFSLRSAGLSAFRLLSHLATYALVMFVAGRMVAAALRELKASPEMAERKV